MDYGRQGMENPFVAVVKYFLEYSAAVVLVGGNKQLRARAMVIVPRARRDLDCNSNQAEIVTFGARVNTVDLGVGGIFQFLKNNFSHGQEQPLRGCVRGVITRGGIT
jgi:hypothetical protein